MTGLASIWIEQSGEIVTDWIFKLCHPLLIAF
jgi:hypothetical protein